MLIAISYRKYKHNQLDLLVNQDYLENIFLSRSAQTGEHDAEN